MNFSATSQEIVIKVVSLEEPKKKILSTSNVQVSGRPYSVILDNIFVFMGNNPF